MVEVFKTNVVDEEDARKILNQIHLQFTSYRANFALDDCDKILRVKCLSGIVSPLEIISILDKNGFTGNILPDDFQASMTISLVSNTLRS
ncbi:MAG: hypothetical protein EOO90_11380 [Pedobacter sp.]|nr:MAG: hypothetical protein EOO90_11380 [Pedobacter sp.]